MVFKKNIEREKIKKYVDEILGVDMEKDLKDKEIMFPNESSNDQIKVCVFFGVCISISIVLRTTVKQT